ncbi:unnamed protein product [Auanema sp. JU1783]|nr:unnamed protein product [Auanema sp. JU1783]
MALLCPYLKCEETDDCIEEVKPIGHCCPICGALVHFVGYDIGYENVKMDIEKFIQKHPQIAENYGFELDRLDDDETPSSYQITIYKTNMDIGFDEQPVKDLLGYLEYKLHQQLRTTLKVTQFQIYMSRTDRSIQLSSIILGSLLFVTLMVTISMKIIWSDPILYERFSMNFRDKIPSLSFAVHFHAGRDENEIQMIAKPSQISDEYDDLKSEEEEEKSDGNEEMKDEIKGDFITTDHLKGITNPTFEVVNETSEELKLIDL